MGDQLLVQGFVLMQKLLFLGFWWEVFRATTNAQHLCAFCFVLYTMFSNLFISKLEVLELIQLKFIEFCKATCGVFIFLNIECEVNCFLCASLQVRLSWCKMPCLIRKPLYYVIVGKHNLMLLVKYLHY
jgi:hypothetical protein